MKLDELMTSARDAVTVRRVFAEPIERDGVTVIPAARVAGGGGGGGGHDGNGQEGEGGGFGVLGRPAGVFVIKDGAVSWRPAVDAKQLVATVGVVVVAYLLTHPRRRRRRVSEPRRPRGRRPGRRRVKA